MFPGWKRARQFARAGQQRIDRLTPANYSVLNTATHQSNSVELQYFYLFIQK
jgi:hypothetical protein